MLSPESAVGESGMITPDRLLESEEFWGGGGRGGGGGGGSSTGARGGGGAQEGLGELYMEVHRFDI